MNNFFISFLITVLSGLSTIIGTILIFFNVKNKNKIIGSSLIFSASIMIFISIFDLIPSSFNYINKIYEFIPSIMLILIYIIFGGLLTDYISKKNNNKDNLYKVGIISMLALIVHNIPEGIITFLSSSIDLSIGIPLAISIALHNIPEGIAISVPIYYSKNDKTKALKYTFIAALSEPLGAVIAFLFLRNINDYLFSIIFSITSGIMLYIAIFELIKESLKCNSLKDNVIYFILGIFVMLLSSYFV